MKKAFSKKNLWENVPPLFKSTVGRVMGIIPPAYWLGQRFRDHCRFLQDSQWWSADRAQQYQLAKLRQVLTLAYQKTDFYHQAFDAIGFHPDDFESLEDIQQLPTIDKDIVIENIDEMCTRSIKRSDVDYGSTGGTSGTPLHFYFDANRSSIEYAYLTTSWKRVNYRLGMPMAVIRGRIVKARRDGLYHEYDPLLRHHYYSNFHMNEENMYRYLKHIECIGPCMLHGYPSSAHSFAKYILSMKLSPPSNIKGVLLESENIYTDQVEDIEMAFGVRAWASYGHSEKLVYAAQCEKSRDYHVWPTYGYFELIGKNGKVVEEIGQEGEIIGTGFLNTVMPFVRYRTGDWATYGGNRCEACGREHTILKNIRGRWPQGGLIAIDGSVISMTALNVHDDTFENVREYQFVQSIPGEVTLLVIPINTLSEDNQRRIIANMTKRLQGQIVLKLETRKELVKTALGKQPRVVRMDLLVGQV